MAIEDPKLREGFVLADQAGWNSIESMIRLFSLDDFDEALLRRDDGDRYGLRRPAVREIDEVETQTPNRFGIDLTRPPPTTSGT